LTIDLYTCLHTEKGSVYFINAYISYWMHSHSCSRLASVGDGWVESPCGRTWVLGV